MIPVARSSQCVHQFPAQADRASADNQRQHKKEKRNPADPGDMSSGCGHRVFAYFLRGRYFFVESLTSLNTKSGVDPENVTTLVRSTVRTNIAFSNSPSPNTPRRGLREGPFERQKDSHLLVPHRSQIHVLATFAYPHLALTSLLLPPGRRIEHRSFMSFMGRSVEYQILCRTAFTGRTED